jgi:uncharacterized protein (UPF0303 family)
MSELGEHGLLAGRDLAITGFDGVIAAAHSNPTVDHGRYAPASWARWPPALLERLRSWCAADPAHQPADAGSQTVIRISITFGLPSNVRSTCSSRRAVGPDTMNDYTQELAAMLLEEEELQFRAFTNDTALRLGLLFADIAGREGNPSLSTSPATGRCCSTMPCGTSADNDAWIEQKRVVDHYGHSSFYIGTLYASQGVTFEQKSRLDPGRYAAAGGCFPVIVRNVGPVGTVSVSGLPQAEDHELVVRILRQFLADGGDRSTD